MAETENNKTEDLSQDEVYAKVETDKLVKAKSRKKIATIAALSVFLAIAVVIILLTSIPVSLRPKCVSTDFESVSFYINSSSSTPSGKILANQKEDATKKEKFLKAFDQAFSQSYFSALFSGALNQYEINDEILSSFSNAKESLKNTKYIDIKYSSNQVLTNKNGSQYVSKSKVTAEALTFDEVYIAVSQTNGMSEVTLYLCVDYPESKDKLATIKVRGNTYKIFEQWDSFIG